MPCLSKKIMFKYLSDYTCKIKHNQIFTAADDYESPLHNKTTVSLNWKWYSSSCNTYRMFFYFYATPCTFVIKGICTAKQFILLFSGSCDKKTFHICLLLVSSYTIFNLSFNLDTGKDLG